MLTIPPAVRIYACTRPTDMRKGFDGLSALVRDVLDEDPLSGHLFVFCNRRADRVKLLVWDRSGFCLWYKRLEAGVFRFPDRGAVSCEMTSGELLLILEGIDLAGARRRERFSLPPRKAR